MSVDVSVVFPTYNEAENIVTLIRRTDNALQNYNREIIVMDDDSPDKTWLLAQNEKNPRVKVVRRINKRKLVTAIQEGIDAANGKVVVWMDADLSMPPELIPKLLARMNRADIVVGSRYAPGGRDKRPLLRVLSSFSVSASNKGSSFLVCHNRNHLRSIVVLNFSSHSKTAFMILFSYTTSEYNISRSELPSKNSFAHISDPTMFVLE